ncbi:MAG: DegT/DnrJ/EryC1/StrS aminotransferase family protein, partial [Treponema sp.]|nr:DegT/DnrJ/EryC1/StrS aminotransferase family protein [Treponema sp.]
LRCLAVNSATSGLHLALAACGIGRGDLVLVPSYTFTSTAEAARYLEADPLFVDVVPGGFNLDPGALEKTLEGLPPGRAKAVIPVHFGGLPCDMKAVLDLAETYGLRVIEDAAHSFPSPLEGGSAGALGDAGVFSFFATKPLTTGDGGMVVTRNGDIARRAGVLRSHGIDRSVWSRYTDTGASWYYEVVEAGYKYNIPDLLAALGRVQLTRAFRLLELRQDIARRYDGAFGGDPHFIIPPTGPGDARHLYPLRLRLDRLGLDRDEFIEKIQEQGIGVSVHFIPLHTMPYYRNRYGLREEDFPETMKSFRSVVSLPIWPGMESAQTERVITVVKSLAIQYTL